ncbi:hypothetical protein Scep_021522 [Stephania cephalantha]|uniref:Uncharacterized protein n=1 Tax=Stephania cephalantha TaxID=152367 RepID=A0AAP0FBD9_9MAGN
MAPAGVAARARRNDSRKSSSDSGARPGRIGSDEPATTRRDETRREKLQRRGSGAAASERRAMAGRRQRGGAFLAVDTTTRWSFIVVHCFVMINIVEIVVDRVGPLASESWLLFICDMSSYPNAVDISQLSVRWGL